jgi:sec-independent protein translocase protein TatA
MHVPPPDANIQIPSPTRLSGYARTEAAVSYGPGCRPHFDPAKLPQVIGDILQPTHLLFILVIALLVLGPKRLPEAGRSLGRGLRDFRSALSGDDHDRVDAVSAQAPVESTPVESTPPAKEPAEHIS